MKPPKYYDQKYREEFDKEFEIILERRKQLMQQTTDNTPERLRQREQVKLRQAAMLAREI